MILVYIILVLGVALWGLAIICSVTNKERRADFVKALKSTGVINPNYDNDCLPGCF